MHVHGYLLTSSNHKIFITTGNALPTDAEYAAAPSLTHDAWLQVQLDLRVSGNAVA